MRLARSSLLRHLRIFCVCARCLSFKAAAQSLHLTPSAISHQIRELEEQLGLQLFARRTRALELTTAGQTLLDEVEPLLLAIEDVLARLAPARDREAVHVALPPFFASELFIPRLGNLYREHGSLDIQIDTHDPMPREHAATADLSVLITESPPAGVVCDVLFDLRLVGACSPATLQRLATLGRDALLDVPVFVHRFLPAVWDQWAALAGLAPPPLRNVVAIDNMFAVTRAAERGVGIALVPTVVSESWFASGSLVRVDAPDVLTRERYCLACREADASRETIRIVREWAIREFRQNVAPHP
jgi:LysR family transcriptional regulator, glycine cleavage system transcriptional activator